MPPSSPQDNLLPQHAHLLDRSGIDQTVRKDRGYRSATRKTDLLQLGFHAQQCIVPALVLPVWGVNGHVVQYQIRPDQPRISNGKPARYELPRGSSTALDVPPRVRPQLGDPRMPLVITSGICQADAAASKSLCCIALLGVWSWRGTNKEGGRTALAEWEGVALNGRQVYIVFGSALATSHSTHAAATRLKSFLESRGASIQVIQLPIGTAASPVGLDDYLAAGHSSEELLALATRDLPPPPELNEPPIEGSRYRITPQGLCREDFTENGIVLERLTNFVATIVHQFVLSDGVDEQCSFEIQATVNGKTRRFAVPAAEFEGMAWVTPNLGAEAVIEAGPQARDHTRAAIQFLSETPIPTDWAYQHTGWIQHQSKRVYLHAGGAIGAEPTGPAGQSEADRPNLNSMNVQGLAAPGPQGPLPGKDSKSSGIRVYLPAALSRYSLPTPPIGRRLQKAIRCSLQFLTLGPDRVVLPVYAAIWRAAQSSADFSLFLAGKTGTGKTTLAALAQQHFGAGWDRNHLPGSWGSTPNYLQSLAFLAKNAIFCVDDWVLTGSRGDIDRANRHAEQLLRSQGNQVGRGRCYPDGRPRETKPPRGLILVTGEAVPSGASLNARNFITEVQANDLLTAANLPRITACQKYAEKGLFAEAMAGFLAWLAPQYEKKLGETKDQAARLRREVFQQCCLHLRSATIAAELLAGLELFLEFAQDQGALQQSEFDDIWKRFHEAMFALLPLQNLHIEAEDPVQAYLSLLAAALLGGRAHIADLDGGPPGRFATAWGWREETYLVPNGPSSGAPAGEGKNEEFVEHRRHRPCGKPIGFMRFDDLLLEPAASLAAAQEMAHACGQFIPLTVKSLGKALSDAGLLVSRETHRNRFTMRKNVGGRRSNFLHLRPASVLSPHWPSCDRLEPGHEGPMDDLFNPPEIDA